MGDAERRTISVRKGNWPEWERKAAELGLRKGGKAWPVSELIRQAVEGYDGDHVGGTAHALTSGAEGCASGDDDDSGEIHRKRRPNAKAFALAARSALRGSHAEVDASKGVEVTHGRNSTGKTGTDTSGEESGQARGSEGAGKAVRAPEPRRGKNRPGSAGAELGFRTQDLMGTRGQELTGIRPQPPSLPAHPPLAPWERKPFTKQDQTRRK